MKGKTTSASVLKDVILLPSPKIPDVLRWKTREELYIRELIYPACELMNEMSSESMDRLSFFQQCLKGRYFKIVRPVGNKIVAADLPQDSITGRVIKHFSGQGPVYTRCVMPIETDSDWVSDKEQQEASSGDENDNNDTVVVNDDDDASDLLKPPYSFTISTSSSSASDPSVSAMNNGSSFELLHSLEDGEVSGSEEAIPVKLTVQRWCFRNQTSLLQEFLNG